MQAFRKELIVHFTFFLALFLFVSIYKSFSFDNYWDGWFNLSYLPFWLGGVVGTVLPDIDHLIYVYILEPHELTSQRVKRLARDRKFKSVAQLLLATRHERGGHIFHTAQIQLVFILFTLLVITSSGSLLGRGIMLAFLLHLVIDQVLELLEEGNINSWFKKIPLDLDREHKMWYLAGNVIFLFFFGFFL